MCINFFFVGKSKQYLNKLSYQSFLSNDLKLNKLYEELIQTKNSKYIISSASLEIYLKYFFSDNILINGTKLSFNKNDICVGLLENNYGNKKVLNLKKIGINEIDQFYTDSFSDKPLMSISKKTFLVSKGKIKKVITN